jgi:hypothetical protein
VAGLIAELRELERCDEAERLGQQTLERCRQLQIGVAAHPVQREVAMVEARLGDFSGAAARLEALIEEQCALGDSGLHLGASYEARARVALWARDEDAVAKYSRATARQYRHGGGSPLGARYERLMDEAREVFPRRLAELAQLDLAAAGRTQAEREFSTTRIVTQVFRQATHADQRAELALSLLCEDHAARAGYLYICKDGGLTLAAARGAPPPEPRLAGLAHSHIQRQIDAMDMATQIADGLESTTQPAIADANGVVYDPVLLTCSVDDALCYVGVALLVPAADAQPQSHRELVTAIASQLFEAGDAPGITG